MAGAGTITSFFAPINKPPPQHHIPRAHPERMDIDQPAYASQVLLPATHMLREYSEDNESINLAPYAESLPWLISPPLNVPYATSVEVATMRLDTHLQVQPIYSHSTNPEAHPEYVFLERLFNFGNIIGKGGHSAMFSSSTGEYKFADLRSKDIALKYGFSSEEGIFRYLDEIKGRNHIPNIESELEKFQTPWHEIDLVFEPRKRGAVEGGTGRRKSKSKAVITKEDESDSPTTGNGDDTMNGVEESSILDMTGQEAIQALNGTTQKKKKKYQPPKKIFIADYTHRIVLEDLIHAVARHPLLLPTNPEKVDFIVKNAPHTLQNVGLLYCLSHGELENEALSEMLGKLGLDVAPNVLAHRKKKALQDLQGNYKERKNQFEHYKRSIKRSNTNANSWREGR